MRRSFLISISTATLLGFALVFYEREAIQQGREALTAERHRLVRHEQSLAELRQQLVNAQNEFQALDQRFSAPASEAISPLSADPAHAGEIISWLARVKLLKQTFEDDSTLGIPELQFLTDLDWLALVRNMKLDSKEDLRQAQAEARNEAFGKFRRPLLRALRDYATASGGVALSDVSQLLPYLQPPVDAAILRRYEITGAADSNAQRDNRRITERAPVDIEFDHRHTVGIDGQSVGGGPWSVEELRQATVEAQREFSAANNGKPSVSNIDLLPYVHNPTVKIIFEGMVAYQRDHYGQSSTDSAVLRPYIQDPAAQRLLERMIKAQQNRSEP